jgi:hypothetical protein
MSRALVLLATCGLARPLLLAPSEEVGMNITSSVLESIGGAAGALPSPLGSASSAALGPSAGSWLQGASPGPAPGANMSITPGASLSMAPPPAAQPSMVSNTTPSLTLGGATLGR